MPWTKLQGFNSSSYVKWHEPIVLWNWCLLQMLSLPSKHSSYLCKLWNVCELSAVQETDLLYSLYIHWTYLSIWKSIDPYGSQKCWPGHNTHSVIHHQHTAESMQYTHDYRWLHIFSCITELSHIIDCNYSCILFYTWHCTLIDSMTMFAIMVSRKLKHNYSYKH